MVGFTSEHLHLCPIHKTSLSSQLNSRRPRDPQRMPLLPRVLLLRQTFFAIQTFANPRNFSHGLTMGSTSTPTPNTQPASITSPPAHHQHIRHEDVNYDTVKEGLAYILNPRPTSSSTTSTNAKNTKKDKAKEDGERENGVPQQVFYNPIQQFNRDLSVLCIRAFGEEAIRVKRELWEKRRGIFVGRSNKRKRVEEENGGAAAAVEVGVDGGEVGGRKRKRVDGEEVETRKANRLGEEMGGEAEGTAKKRRVEDAEKGSNGVHDFTEGAVERGWLAAGVGRLDKDKQDQTRLSGESTSAPRQDATNGLQVDEDANGNSVTQSGWPESGDMSQKSTSKPFHTSFTILDALSATGLRALRYAKELPFVTTILANDMSSKATKSISLNIRHNNLCSKVFPHTGDARAFMYTFTGPSPVKVPPESSRYFGKFDVIDLDPYGTAAPFFDAAVQAITDGGLLAVTCTDAGVFASSGYPEKTFYLYGGLPMRGPQSHEAGLRLILNAIAVSAARYSMAIEPLLSLSIDFYARLFVRVHRSPSQTKFLAGKTMLVYSCDYGCGAWTTQSLGRNKETPGKNNSTFWKHSHAQGPTTSPECEHCGTRMHIAGPMWAGPLHSSHFVQSVLDLLPRVDRETYPTLSRIEGMLATALEEDLDVQGSSDPSNNKPEYPEPVGPNNAGKLDHHPFFIIPNTLCKVIHCQTPDEDSLRGALRQLGYRVSRSHTKAGSIKTDAPWNVLWDIIREWARQRSPIKADSIKENTAGWGIMQKGRELSGQDTLTAMKTHFLAAVEKSKDIETLMTEVEAAMYRAERWTNGIEASAARDPGKGNAEAEDINDAKEDAERKKEYYSIPKSKLSIVFDQRLQQLGKKANEKKLVRYQMNPRKDWGPMVRARSGAS
jgi:tRNA (guanine26-N2/guanine27-N2)-dimethyltransferase